MLQRGEVAQRSLLVLDFLLLVIIVVVVVGYAYFNYFQARNDTAANIGNALQVANVNGVNAEAGIKTDYSKIAPRIGFAYSVTPTIVLRGGYGLSYFPGNYTSNADLKNAPFVSVFTPNCQ